MIKPIFARGGLRATLDVAALAIGLGAVVPAHASATLDKIKERGLIRVGVGTQPGFFAPDANDKWQGFFIDFGRALAVAVFNGCRASRKPSSARSS